MEERKSIRFLTALDLKVLAMVLMVCDHAWATVVPGLTWLTAIGRVAFPIFAFQVAEGFFLTHDRKKYLKRMFLFALISELPFNLMAEGGILAPLHQNVMFTFCLALLAMMALERAKKKGKIVFLLLLAAMIPATFIVGLFTFVDYYGYGIWMVLAFYLFRNARFGWLGEIVSLFYINWIAIGGLVFNVELFGRAWQIPEQGFALLALIPIWLYNGRQGPHSKMLQYACYAFYPAHMLLLFILSRLIYG